MNKNSFKELGVLPYIPGHVYIKGDTLYSNDIYDISNLNDIKKVSSLIDSQDSIRNMTIKDNILYLSTFHSLCLYDISNISKPKRLSCLPITGGVEDFKIKDNLIFVNSSPDYMGTRISLKGGVYIFDISNPKKPKELYYRYLFPYNIEVDDNYLYLSMTYGLHILNWKELLNNELVRKNYYYPQKNIFLTDESPKNYEVKKGSFTKKWKFNEVINNYDIEVLQNTYKDYNKKLNFQKYGNVLSVELKPYTPYTNSVINRLELRLKDKKVKSLK
jgi:hypothetical protein